MEQTRIYETILAGAVPVLELNDDTRSYLPPSYLESPMVFVESWADVVDEMIRLSSDMAALQRRQQELLRWHESLMRGVLLELETVLEARHEAGEFCKPHLPANTSASELAGV